MDTLFVLRLALTLFLAGIGAWVALKIKIPAGVFLGPIIVIGTYQVFAGTLMERPVWLRTMVQIAVGIVLGTSFAKVHLGELKKLIKPTLTVCAMMLGGGLAIALILGCTTGWDYKTVILATTPGGQGEMAILSDSVGAATEKVIILQLVRNQLVMLFMLPLARAFYQIKPGRRITDHED
ncbi:MAG: AbrB family transcriptional regulator [Dehalobacterium sp.]